MQTVCNKQHGTVGLGRNVKLSLTKAGRILFLGAGLAVLEAQVLFFKSVLCNFICKMGRKIAK